MSTTTRRRSAPAKSAATDGAAVPVVGGREPCPCGSGRRYKACHGKAGAGTSLGPRRRPFAGRVDEPDLVALREVVPSATAPLRLVDHVDRDVTLGTLLPGGLPAMVRADGRILLSLQTASRSGDLDRDIGQALLAALESEPGRGVSGLPVPDAGAGLCALLTPDALEITVHAGFDWWLDGADEPGAEAQAAMEQANASVVPTARLTSVVAGYWCRIGARTHLRWALPEDEDALLDAFARLHHAAALDLGEGTKYVGAFRAHGVLVPVWDLPEAMEAADVEAPAAALRKRLDETLADPRSLTSDERRTRAGVVSRQLTLR